MASSRRAPADRNAPQDVGSELSRLREERDGLAVWREHRIQQSPDRSRCPESRAARVRQSSGHTVAHSRDRPPSCRQARSPPAAVRRTGERLSFRQRERELRRRLVRLDSDAEPTRRLRRRWRSRPPPQEPRAESADGTTATGDGIARLSAVADAPTLPNSLRMNFAAEMSETRCRRSLVRHRLNERADRRRHF